MTQCWTILDMIITLIYPAKVYIKNVFAVGYGMYIYCNCFYAVWKQNECLTLSHLPVEQWEENVK